MDMEKALQDPASVFDSPDDVVRDTTLSDNDKAQILRRWEYDALELAVAEEENMAGDQSDQLERVHAALNKIQRGAAEHEAPTKQGGE